MSKENETESTLIDNTLQFFMEYDVLDNYDKLDYDKIVNEIANIDRAQLQALSEKNKDIN